MWSIVVDSPGVGASVLAIMDVLTATLTDEGERLTQVIAITPLPESLWLVQIGSGFELSEKGGRI